MSTADIRSTVHEELGNIAPEMDVSGIDPSVDLREALDIDSMDFLNFVTAMHRRLGVNVPETDYGKLATLDKTVAYFEAKLAEGPTS